MGKQQVYEELTASLRTPLLPSETVEFAGRFRFETPNPMFADTFRQGGAVVVVTGDRLIVEAEGVEGVIPRSALGTAVLQGAGTKTKARVPVAEAQLANDLLFLALQLGDGELVLHSAIAGTVPDLLDALGILPAPATSTPAPQSKSSSTTAPVPPTRSSTPPRTPITTSASPPNPVMRPVVQPAPVVSSPPPMPPPKKRSKVLSVGLTLGILALVVVFGATFLGKEESTKFSSVSDAVAAGPTSTTTRVTSVPTPSPPAPASSPVAQETTTTLSGPRTFRVVNTGWCETKACRISLRLTPNDDLGTTYTDPVRSRGEGDSVVVTCQVFGRVAEDTETGRSSPIWNGLDNGYYISDLFLDTPTSRGEPATFPIC